MRKQDKLIATELGVGRRAWAEACAKRWRGRTTMWERRHVDGWWFRALVERLRTDRRVRIESIVPQREQRGLDLRIYELGRGDTKTGCRL